MRKVFLIALLMASILYGSQPCGSSASQKETGAGAVPVSEGSIKVTITTGGGLHGPVRSKFKVGEEIPVVVSLTNTGDQPATYCLSTAVFQNRPRLARDGQTVPYLTNLPERSDKEDAIQICERSAARQFYSLQPKQTRVVDWISLSPKGIEWYGALTAGHYEVSLMRRIECCQGPLVESNTVAFDIVP